MLQNNKQITVTILIAFASSFLLSNMVRNINSIVAPSLIKVFELNNDELGLITSVFLVAFAVAQLPLGVAIDKYGARISHMVLLIFAIIGCLMFAFAQNYITLIIARLLIGLGVSGGLICGLVALATRVSGKELSFMYGIYMAFGGLGVLLAGYPSLVIYELVGWRGLFVIMALISAICLKMVIGISKDSLAPINRKNQHASSGFADFITIIKSPYFQAVAPFVGIANGIFSSCIGIWASVFMREVQNLSEVEIASIISLSAIMLIIGAPLTGYIATSKNAFMSKISLENLILIVILPAPVFLFLAIYPVNILPYDAQWNWLGVAFCFSIIIQVYTVVTNKFPLNLAGRVNTAINVCFFMGAFIIQYGTGVIIQLLIDYSNLDIKIIYIYVMLMEALLILFSVLWLPARLYFVKKS